MVILEHQLTFVLFLRIAHFNKTYGDIDLNIYSSG